MFTPPNPQTKQSNQYVHPKTWGYFLETFTTNNIGMYIYIALYQYIYISMYIYRLYMYVYNMIIKNTLSYILSPPKHLQTQGTRDDAAGSMTTSSTTTADALGGFSP